MTNEFCLFSTGKNIKKYGKWKMKKGWIFRKMENGKWKMASLVKVNEFLPALNC